MGKQWRRTSDALGPLTKVLEPNGTTKTMETDYGYDCSPAFAARLFRVNDYGAKGDGATVDTAAIQAALDAAARDGHGEVTFAPGIYLSGAISVKSGTIFRFDKGVTWRAVPALSAYPMMPTRVAGIEMRWLAALSGNQRQRHRGRQWQVLVGWLLRTAQAVRQKRTALGRRLRRPSPAAYSDI